MFEIGLIGGGSLGALFGLLLGLFLSKKLNLTPSAEELQKALEVNELYYKKQVARFRGRVKEYEHPEEIRQMINQSGGSQEDLVSMFVQNLGSIKSLPRWVRPFIPAIQSWIKENPDKIAGLIQKFTGGKKDDSQFDYRDLLNKPL